jgi:hypothetical protein
LGFDLSSTTSRWSWPSENVYHESGTYYEAWLEIPYYIFLMGSALAYKIYSIWFLFFGSISPYSILALARNSEMQAISESRFAPGDLSY